ncbi:multicopper oxidase domain-containing protein [Nitriliruptor alkaliphilus]|uniref:multicopper oxidase domain-containing protein n=1 Tax=Nitriliruptor alkaliphilus TaxID=427918 RepID=UPI00069673E5|nr:multicopper oxidase domain-containing protein [Nitriliruptor alkaliphilus]
MDELAEARTMGSIATAVLAAVALVLSAGALITSVARDSGGPATVAPAEAVAPTSVAVELSEFAIAPADITIPAGGTLEVVNVGNIPHDLAVVDEGIGTAMLNNGESESLSLAGLAPGTYTVHCTVAGHEAGGMKATLTITEGDAGTVAAAPMSDHSGHGSHGPDTDWAAYDQVMHDSIAEYPAATEGIGNQLLEPTILEDGTKRFELTAQIVEWEVEPGNFVEAWTYNGTVPGPVIRADIGDKVEVVVHNELPLGTDVHWHGVKIDNEFDGVAPLTQELIAPNESFTYRFTATESYVSMYHPHHHSQFKIPNGMWGAVLIGDVPLPEAGSVIGGRTLPDDMTISQEFPMVMNDAGTIGMSLNGKSFPATAPIVAKKGDNILMHYYNEGLQIHPMHLHGFPQLVVAKDGFPLDQPYWADTVNVAPGERYTVMFTAEEVGAWVFHCHILTHAETDDGMYGMVTAVIVEE